MTQRVTVPVDLPEAVTVPDLTGEGDDYVFIPKVVKDVKDAEKGRVSRVPYDFTDRYAAAKERLKEEPERWVIPVLAAAVGVLAVVLLTGE